jgi:uncharacterized membrane protein
MESTQRSGVVLKVYTGNERRFPEDNFYILLTIEFFVYVIVWSFISVSKLMAIHAYALDLGVFQQSLFFMIHPLSLNSWVVSFFNSPFRLIVSPFSLLNSFIPIIITQTIFIALPVFPLYAIGKHFLKERLAPFFISTSYLIFYGIAGVNWYDVHAQAFFIFFFITGYFLFLRKKYWLSILLFTISGAVRFPYAIFPALLGLVTLIQIKFWPDSLEDGRNHKLLTFSLCLLIIQVAFLVASFSVMHFLLPPGSNLFGFAHVSSPVSNYAVGKIVTIPLFLAPFLFLPLYKNKWSLFLVPFYFLVFYADYNWYVYPWILWDQYASGIVPFLYLGTIEGLTKWDGFNKPNKSKAGIFRRLSKNSRVALAILVVIALLALVFQPYGPLNPHTDANFYFHDKTTVNLVQYNALDNIVDLIPRNDPYVFFQDNIPEVLLRDHYVSTVGFAAGIAGLAFPYNLTYRLMNGSWTNRIDYVMFDYNSRFFYYEGNYPTNLSFYAVAQKLYASDHYGIMADEYGFVLLNYSYVGPVLYGGSFSDDISLNSLIISGGGVRNANEVTWNNTSHSPLFSSPEFFVSPGTYDLTIQLSKFSGIAGGSILINVSSPSNGVLLKSIELNSTTISNHFANGSGSFVFTVKNFYDNVEISAYSQSLPGSISLSGMNITGVIL